MTDSTNSSIKMPIRRMNVDELDNNTTALFNTQRTNCITEIPQDIKLELLNGELKLLAGSKIYIPNGFEADGTTPKFSVRVLTEDIVRTKAESLYTVSNAMLILRGTDNFIDFWHTIEYYSGPIAPSTGNIWYDTMANLIKRNISGTWTSEQQSLPIGIVNVSDTDGFTSINQVFNGFGYIGSTVFVLPGVRGLSPNGRNADGTLKNIECVYTSPQTMTLTSSWGTGNEICFINGVNLDAHRNSLAFYVSDIRPSNVHLESFWFNPKENQHYYTMDTGASWIPFYAAHAFDISFTSGVVDTLKPKTPFHVLDDNDRAIISSWGMPSENYDILTLGATGTAYAAPANGYFAFFAQYQSGVDAWVNIQNTNTPDALIGMDYFWYSSKGSARFFCPAKKGDNIVINYNCVLKGIYFEFIYTEGEN